MGRGQLLVRFINPHPLQARASSGWGLYLAAFDREGKGGGQWWWEGGRRRSLLFLGHVSPASCSRALPWHYRASVGSSVKLEPAPQSLWSRLRIFGALCRWPPRTQNMADGAQANPKGFKKKVLVRHPFGWRGPSLRASSALRTSRYVPAPLGWNPLWKAAEMGVGNWFLKFISLARRALSR